MLGVVHTCCARAPYMFLTRCLIISVPRNSVPLNAVDARMDPFTECLFLHITYSQFRRKWMRFQIGQILTHFSGIVS